ncbi:hypothetical protein FOPG_07900 [Fusarium oxysporum f. sp. conglutinans race 2 54008]|uniref:Uncharacterized protein n=1 Tax=Fusarium oxysporum f. sp. conglutinans race 2 54008 TaxID=1089457 RepID=X0I1G3_FUSOX|nr:hypothetical protein FOPG_07900 [Fusarium oxysporum f. sp. conglutinans race 2 54008]
MGLLLIRTLVQPSIPSDLCLPLADINPDRGTYQCNAAQQDRLGLDWRLFAPVKCSSSITCKRELRWCQEFVPGVSELKGTACSPCLGFVARLFHNLCALVSKGA